VVKGFSLGADDYITKPFNSGELMARINRVLRESAER
jgi:two-component system OmpR family response regulator